MSQTDKEMVRGAIILTYAGLLSKVLSAFYRIPLQNITGDVGFYIYQQIYPFIGMMTMMMLYGLPQSMAALVIEHPQMRQNKRYIRLFLYSVTTLLFSLLFFSAPILAEWMGDQQLMRGLRVSFLLLWVVPELALQRGFSQAEGRMEQTALSQVLEQLFRVGIIIGGAVLVMRTTWSLYAIGVVASIGAIIGAVVATCYFHFNQKRVRPMTSKMKGRRGAFNYRVLVKPLIFYSVIIAMNHMMLLLLQWVDAFTLVELLHQQGVDLSEAKQLKGILDRAQPLSQLGIVASSAITLALVPGLTQATKNADLKKFMQLATTAYRFGLYLSTAATAGLIILMPKVNLVLFKDTAGTVSLQLFVVSIVFTSLAILTSSIMQANGKGKHVVIAIISGLTVKYLGNQLLIPLLLLPGAAVSTVLGTLTIFVVNHMLLGRQLKQRFSVPLRGMLGALLALTLSVVGLDVILDSYLFSESRFLQLIYLLGLIVVGVVVYSLALIKFKAVTTEEKQLLMRK
ncbi:polysaccharide transporter, PST family [Halolactibacillus halophilus]|uniref:Polysaccharide biosynthesis family protein n=1 Tax=Halolactibacillus halophilus TaxID=306540 RepID=A0A1I5R2P1_9BACI|nr:polysaccharide biosynthesis protein [Halolactibacillus halophilus]GEM02282.1 polysaccharide biosynthesis family protein [Halolactibacillus halophilus]SFP52824.1 polysaccharide transporter, PST family [Halolactibacillus halophilus]